MRTIDSCSNVMHMQSDSINRYKFEMGVMENKYSAAYQLLKNDWKIEDIARITELDQDQIKQLID